MVGNGDVDFTGPVWKGMKMEEGILVSTDSDHLWGVTNQLVDVGSKNVKLYRFREPFFLFLVLDFNFFFAVTSPELAANGFPSWGGITVSGPKKMLGFLPVGLPKPMIVDACPAISKPDDGESVLL